jgi:hypothetical protein
VGDVTADQPLFLAIGRHGPVSAEEGRRVAVDALGWLESRLADGTLEAVYSMEGGGRAIIARSASDTALLELLRSAPDVERTWQITRLYDGLEVIRSYLADTGGSTTG